MIIIWISNTKEVHSKPMLHVSLSTSYLQYGRHVVRLHRRRRRRAYAPTSNTASHDNHEKINSWVSFCFPYMGCLWGSAWRPGAPLIFSHSCYTTVVNDGLHEPYLLLTNTSFILILSESHRVKFVEIPKQKFESQLNVINPFSIL